MFRAGRRLILGIILVSTASPDDLVPLRFDLDMNPIGINFPDMNVAPPPELVGWPAPDTGQPPLAVAKYGRRPYTNPAGRAWIARINGWVAEGSAAGLAQDGFLSLDRVENKAHSTLVAREFPGMRFLEPVYAPSGFRNVGSGLFLEGRVTFAVHSLGFGRGVLPSGMRSDEDFENILDVRRENSGVTQLSYRTLYLNNVLYCSPALRKDSSDDLTFLTPYCLHSAGASGTDSRLLKPIVWAAASIRPGLKTRILREGAYVPTLMYLFKRSITPEGIRDPEAHLPAYALPAEALAEDTAQSAFLDRLLNVAHEIDHVPAITRMKVVEHSTPRFHQYSVFGYVAALRRGEALELTVDLSKSWTDRRAIEGHHAQVLRGKAELDAVEGSASAYRLKVGWSSDKRVDVLFLANDGAPAYVSVRNIQLSESALFPARRAD